MTLSALPLEEGYEMYMSDTPKDQVDALTARGVRKTYEAENAPVRALRGVDLVVPHGEFIAHIGIVFQFFNLLDGMTVLENVALPAVIAGRSRRAAESRARDLLDLLGIAEKAGAVPGVLSGGQRQRLAIARALANEPTLLLADEPTGALDSEGGLEIAELLGRLHEGGQTILLVTHDAGVAASAQRIVQMQDGRILGAAATDSPLAAAAGSAGAPSGT
jgi:putative ABC transport system ATP-binding protein